jgi:phosphoglycerate dehydrogenase-like enzyme
LVRILIPDTVTFALPDLPLEVIRFSARETPDPALDAEALVWWGVPKKVLEPLLDMPNLRWVQTLTAGVDHILNLHPREHIVVTNGKGLHDAPTAELAVALLLSGVRRLHHFRDEQSRVRWDRAAYNTALEGRALLTLEDARVLVLGMGAIGVEIARRLQPFGCTVEGVANSAGTRGGFKTHALTDLDALLPHFDAIILALPDTPQTHGLISRERLASLNPRAWIVNIGRGSALDEEALCDALEAGSIGGAALDVVAREPLAEDSRLWRAPNCILTPHIAGGGPNWAGKARDLLERNARAFARGLMLENEVDRTRGY